MTTRERLKQIIDGLNEKELERILLFVEESVAPGANAGMTTAPESVESAV